MVGRKTAKGSENESGMERVEKLLALLVLESISQKPDGQKAVLLSRIGFENPEIGKLLGTSAAVVSQHLYEAKTKGVKKKASKKAVKRAKKP